PGQRPFAFMTLDESLAWMTHLEHDRRLILPPGVSALEEVAEEPFLEAHAIVRVEVRPVLDSVHLEPFLLRGCANEPFEVAAWVQALASPVRRGEQRRPDLRPVGPARAPVLIPRPRLPAAGRAVPT